MFVHDLFVLLPPSPSPTPYPPTFLPAIPAHAKYHPFSPSLRYDLSSALSSCTSLLPSDSPHPLPAPQHFTYVYLLSPLLLLCSAAHDPRYDYDPYLSLESDALCGVVMNSLGASA